DGVIATARRGSAGPGQRPHRLWPRCADGGGVRGRHGVEQAGADTGAQPLARRDPGASPAAGRRGAASQAALHHAGQYPPADFRAVLLASRRAAGILPALPREFAAQGFWPARHADPDDAAQGTKPLRPHLKESGHHARGSIFGGTCDTVSLRSPAAMISPLRSHSGSARRTKASATVSGGGSVAGSSPGKTRARRRVRTTPGLSKLARTRVVAISAA